MNQVKRDIDTQKIEAVKKAVIEIEEDHANKMKELHSTQKAQLSDTIGALSKEHKRSLREAMYAEKEKGDKRVLQKELSMVDEIAQLKAAHEVRREQEVADAVDAAVHQKEEAMLAERKKLLDETKAELDATNAESEDEATKIERLEAQIQHLKEENVHRVDDALNKQRGQMLEERDKLLKEEAERVQKESKLESDTVKNAALQALTDKTNENDELAAMLETMQNNCDLTIELTKNEKDAIIEEQKIMIIKLKEEKKGLQGELRLVCSSINHSTSKAAPGGEKFPQPGKK